MPNAMRELTVFCLCNIRRRRCESKV